MSMSSNKSMFPNKWHANLSKNKYQWAILFLVIVGIILRLRQYLTVRSLWLDESALALNIINRSYLELFSPLNYGQAAPLLFLWIEKTFTLLGNTSELYLRLFPLMSSLIALILFPYVARKYMSWRATIIAFVFYVLSTSLIYYASEVKQYASDALATLLALLILLFILENSLSNFQAFLLLISGCFLLAVSHSSVFVLASASILFLFVCFRTRSKTEFLRVFVIATGWGITFLGLYLISLSNISEHRGLLSYWQVAFPPSLQDPIAFMRWLGQRFKLFFVDPGGLTLILLAVPIVILGIISLVKRNWILATSIILPVILVLVAAILHKYPFSSRLLLFLTPLLYLLVGEGIDSLFNIKLKPFASLIGVTALLLLLLNPLSEAITDFLSPPMGEDIKPMIQYIDEHWQDGDHLYIYYSSTRPFEYYQDRFEFDMASLTQGRNHRDDWTQYLPEFEAELHNKGRLWLLFSHVYEKDETTEEVYIVENLLQARYQLFDEQHAENASIYLFQLEDSE